MTIDEWIKKMWQGLLLLQSTGSTLLGLPKHVGLVVLWHVGSSLTRDQTPVPCIGRWILNHWTIRTVPEVFFN